MTALPMVRLVFGAVGLPVILLILSGAPAEAHLVTTGLGPIYDGIGHFLMSPEDLVPTFVLALLAGQCGPKAARWVLFVLPGAWLGGWVAGLVLGAPVSHELTWLIFIVLGSLVAAHLRLPHAAILALAGLLGIFRGYMDGLEMGLMTLPGVLATVFIVTALTAAAVTGLTWAPGKIAIRVLGSWTTATGLLLLGWSLH